MKTNRLRSLASTLGAGMGSCAAALVALSAVPVSATPLSETAAVHTKPDRTSPAITYLKAGTEPILAAGALASTPAGWLAVELRGPFEGYVENKDLTKSLDVKPGAPIRLAPKPDAGVLAHGEQNDKISITGLRGKWTQISLEKNLVGYISIGAVPGYLPPIATTPAAAAPAVSPAPVATGAYGVAAPGHAAPMVNLGDSSSTLPRQFAGRFVSTRRPFTPRRPYDFALNDDAGRRYAYLDISKLPLTGQIEKYLNHQVVVFGTAKPAAEGRDIVIVIETLQLK